MQTITTKYVPATGRKGSRIVARASGSPGSASVPYQDQESGEPGHAAAVRALMEKLEWSGTMIGGHTRDGMVWVFSEGPRISVSPEAWEASYCGLLGPRIVRRFPTEARARQWAEQVGHGARHSEPAKIERVE